MCNDNAINSEDFLYENYKNYIYKIRKDEIINNEDDNYILFNPSIHYWLNIDKISKEIIELVREHSSVKTVEDKLAEIYNISHETFIADVLPTLNSLVDYGFFVSQNSSTSGEDAEWMKKSVRVEKIDEYPFNDVYISLTDQCNLDCIYCFNKESRNARKNINKRLSDERIISILEEFKKIGGTGVVFTGGEPTLNNSLLKLCKAANNIGLTPSFITNGTLLKKLDIAELFNSVDHIGISLDSICQNEVEELWNTKAINIQKDILDVLEEINTYSRENKKISIRLMPILSEINKNSIGSLVEKVDEILKNCYVTWKITPYSPIGRKEIDDKLGVSDDECFRTIYNKLKELPLNNDFKDLSEKENNLKAFSYSESGKLLPPQKPKFLTCAPSFFITNKGDTYPCQGLEQDEFCIGNASDNTLKDMFTTKEFNEIKKRIVINNIEECSTCELRFVCTNKRGGCTTFADMTVDDCKNVTINRLYLQTQLVQN